MHVQTQADPRKGMYCKSLNLKSKCKALPAYIAEDALAEDPAKSLMQQNFSASLPHRSPNRLSQYALQMF